MKNQRFTILLGLFNLVLILFIAASPHQQDFDKIRVKEFEVIDSKGVVRAAIKTQPDGEVMLRLRDKTGTIRVKLGATEHGSSLVLLNDATEVGVHAMVKNKETKFVVIGKDGKKREL